jgi:hypothetical protein
MNMQRRIKAKPQETAAYQALIDHKQATLNVLLSRIPDISTFAQLGELIGYSHEWVRQRLIQTPDKLYKTGKRYKVPKGVAEDFVRRVFI